MGNARWSNVDWDKHSKATVGQTRNQIFRGTGMDADLDPVKIKFRESVDSDKNPKSTPIIVGADETGSMGILAETIIKHGLGTIMSEIYDRKPVTDPHVMCMALGDAFVDEAPLQVTQFEASIVLAEQVKKFYLEGHGGGNGGESYALAWFFAAYKTKCDAIRKRHRKGYIFTIGDESPHPILTREQVKRFVGMNAEADVDVKTLLDHVQQDWNVFHLIVKPVPDQAVVQNWKALLGERAVQINDVETLAQGIVAIIQLVEGQSASQVMTGWKGNAVVTVTQIAKQMPQLTSGA